VRWVRWLVASMFLVIMAVMLWPQLALWLPTQLGY